MGGGEIEDEPRASALLGDVNENGFADMGDLPGFVVVLLGQDTDPIHVCAANININTDGIANSLDVQPFVNQILP